MQRPGGNGHRAPGEDFKGSSWPGEDPAIHVFAAKLRKTWMPGTSPGMTATNAFPSSCTSPAKAPQPACFPALLAPNRDREIGGGRATRQPGQVRKEAA